MSELYIKEDGNKLIIYSFDQETIDELKDLVDEKDDLSILIDFTEHYWTNGSYQPFDSAQGNPFVGLTSAPCIAQSMSYDDNGDATIEGDFWYFGSYMIKNFIREIIDNGYVVFDKA